ncbi:MAG: hypothetical protein LBB89_12320 [Treponema sp.]|jgi:hypothetical protein|nr:hypothetical protein [Treponema sp.]
MSITDKRKQAAAYREAARIVETQKPEKEQFDIVCKNGTGGKIIYLPVEDMVEMYISGGRHIGSGYKFSVEDLEPLYEALKKMFEKTE